MLDKKYFIDGHLTELALLMLIQGELSGGISLEERALISFHLSECSECMERYLELLSEDKLDEPPAGLTDKIMNAVSEENKKRKRSKIMVMQITKLSVAVCLVVVLSAGGVFDFLGGIPEAMAEHNSSSTQVTQRPEKQRSAFQDAMDAMSDGFNNIAYHLNSIGLERSREREAEQRQKENDERTQNKITKGDRKNEPDK